MVQMTAEDTEKRLHVRTMWKERGERNRKVRIEIPEFGVRPGEFVAIVGGNGTGKSTLLDMLGLILSPDHADIFMLNGDVSIDLRHLSPGGKLDIRRHHFAYVLQTGGLLEFLSIRENILLAARLRNKPPAKIGEIARLLGIEDILDKKPGKTSGGQRQKAAIARALIQEPDIILADEPTSALDTLSATKLMETFRHLTDKAGSSLIMVSHDSELVQESADRFYRFEIEEKPGELLSSVLTEASHFQ